MAVTLVSKLGQLGDQKDLTGFSFLNVQSSQKESIALSGRAADGTLHTDFIEYKDSYTIGYRQVTEEQKLLLDGIFQSQYTNGFLVYTFSDSNGIETNKTVQMSPPSYGPIFHSGTVVYYRSASFTLVEV